MKELTKAEEQVMHHLWQLGQGQLKDLMARFPEPKPAYTTVATVVKVLVEKGFVVHHGSGKLRWYSPAIAKTEYSKRVVRRWVESFFDGSRTALLSFFVGDKDLSLSELEELRQLLDHEIEKQQKPQSNE